MKYILCDKNLFCGKESDKPSFGRRLCNFPVSIAYWNEKASTEERSRFLDFLNGNERVVSEVMDYWVPYKFLEFLPYESRVKMLSTEAGLLELLFNGYQEFVTRGGFGGLPVYAQVLEDSVQVLKIFRGTRADLGPYNKFKISYKVRLKIVSPIESLTDEELSKPYKYGYALVNGALVPNGDRRRDSYCRAVKAVLEHPGRVFCNETGCFITLMPESVEHAESLFMTEFLPQYAYYRNGFLDVLVKYGKEFAPNLDDRAALTETESQVRFARFDRRVISWDCWANSKRARAGFVKVRVPFLENGPHLYVKNCRLGIEFIEDYLRRNESAEAVESASFKIGCFEIEMFAKSSATERSSLRVSDGAAKAQILEFCKALVRFLKASTRFVEYLMEIAEKAAPVSQAGARLPLRSGDKTIPLTAKLREVVLDGVRLDPLTYINHSDLTIARLAAFYVNGGC